MQAHTHTYSQYLQESSKVSPH